MAKEFVPMQNYVLVTPAPEEEVSEGGILLPAGYSYSGLKARTGTIKKFGADFEGFEIGDMIYYQHARVNLKIDGLDYDLVHSDDIYGMYIDLEDEEGGSGAPEYLTETISIISARH